MTYYTKVFFGGTHPLNNATNLSVSALHIRSINGQPDNLGEVREDRSSGELRFSPNNTRTGGEEARSLIEAMLTAHGDAIRSMLRTAPRDRKTLRFTPTQGLPAPSRAS